MPVTFIAGQHGFALFAPYLAAFLAAAHFTRARRKRGSPSVAVPVAPMTLTPALVG